MESSIQYQGSFTADGTAEVIRFPGDVDWITVFNETTTAAGGAGTGVMFRWFKGMTQDYAYEYQKLAADESMVPVIATSGGFTYINSKTIPRIGALNATITAVSAAAIPIVSAGSTTTLVAGDIVQLVDIAGAIQMNGIHFEIDTVVANTSFRLVYAPQIVAGTTGSLYPINYPLQFYPKTRTISKITAASPAVVTTTVSHSYAIGQKVRLDVPSEYGMTQMNGLWATITAVSASTFTTDIDSTAFTAFAWPLTAVAAAGFTEAQVIPFGMDSSSTYSGDFDDSVYNDDFIALSLATGTDSPAGIATNVIRWQAGKVTSLNNE